VLSEVIAAPQLVEVATLFYVAVFLIGFEAEEIWPLGPRETGFG